MHCCSTSLLLDIGTTGEKRGCQLGMRHLRLKLGNATARESGLLPPGAAPSVRARHSYETNPHHSTPPPAHHPRGRLGDHHSTPPSARIASNRSLPRVPSGHCDPILQRQSVRFCSYDSMLRLWTRCRLPTRSCQWSRSKVSVVTWPETGTMASRETAATTSVRTKKTRVLPMSPSPER